MKNKMPVFGVGPFYVITCLILTALGVILNRMELIKSGSYSANNTIVRIIAAAFIIFGIYLWISAVLVKKINVKVKEEKLITDGVFAIVRNPVYTAFMFIFTGVIINEKNLWLLFLPFVFWIFMTVLMKNTEEKWLREKFKTEYDEYCKKVNRVIPWFKKR